jgi:creatinine amidohydrolase
MDPRLLPLEDPRPEDFDRHRLQLLRQHEIAARLDERSVVYLPLGTLEFHAQHLPVGLDALNAEEICLRAAAAQGGLVYPTLHYGTGGSHGSFPWSIIPPTGAEIGTLLAYSLERLDQLGVELAVMFTGHFAPEQVALVTDTAERWNMGDHRMRTLGLSVADATGLAIAPDHAGRFETTLLHAHRPECVSPELIPEPRPGEGDEDPFGSERYDPAHSLWGIAGPDPRDFDPADGPALLDGCVRWVLAQVDMAMTR